MKSETLDQEQEGVETSAVQENNPSIPATDSDPTIVVSTDDGDANTQSREADESPEQGEISDASIEAQLTQATDQIKRQAAEFQNYRRRTENEKRQMFSIGKSYVLEQLLDVFDDLQRTMIAAQEAAPDADSESGTWKSFDSLKSGLELAHQKLMVELKKLDVVIIESVGQAFDEELHEAIMQQPAQEGEDVGIVLTEVQRGFKLGDRVLRHAKVIVSS